jgi:hypothetical protein
VLVKRDCTAASAGAELGLLAADSTRDCATRQSQQTRDCATRGCRLKVFRGGQARKREAGARLEAAGAMEGWHA